MCLLVASSCCCCSNSDMGTPGKLAVYSEVMIAKVLVLRVSLFQSAQPRTANENPKVEVPDRGWSRSQFPGKGSSRSQLSLSPFVFIYHLCTAGQRSAVEVLFQNADKRFHFSPHPPATAIALLTFSHLLLGTKQFLQLTQFLQHECSG